MARDEALLMLVGQEKSPPTVRVYQWSKPTISLGYFQRFSDYQRLPPPAGSLPVVRRLTGGGAILHDLELTYSIAVPVGHQLLRGGANRLYELVHDAVIAALSDLGLEAARCGMSDDSGAARGPFFCFERRHCYDVLMAGGKVAGSAQRRTKSAVLQHGSIILVSHFAQQRTVWDSGASGDNPVPVQSVVGKLIEHLAAIAGVSLRSSAWSALELTTASDLVAKYENPQWTRRL